MHAAPHHYPVDILIAPSHPPVVTADAPALEGIVSVSVRAANLELVGKLASGGDRVLGSMSLRMADLLRARRQALLVALDAEDVVWAKQVSIGATGPVEEVSLANIQEIGVSLAHENVAIEGLKHGVVLSESV